MPRADAPSLAVIRQVAARIFPPTRPLAVEYVAAGVSTFVYRIARGDERFYLRLLPEAGDSFAPEVRAHTLLRERGVSVPEVVFFEQRNETIGLSVMVTTEVAGQPVASWGLSERTPAVLFAAGRELAIINSLPVVGFGWITREHPAATGLAANLPSNRAFLIEHLDGDLALLRARFGDGVESKAIDALIARHDTWLDADQGLLAHGDFDSTHIYAHAGAYSGIIDFGEIRGTDRWYDLGHFRLHDGEHLPEPLLPWLLAGYRSVAPLPDDAERRVAFASLLIGIRTLARTLVKRPTSPLIAHSLLSLRRDLTFLGASAP